MNFLEIQHRNKCLLKLTFEDEIRICQVIEKDAEFLRACGIMDYSLLVNIEKAKGAHVKSHRNVFQSQDMSAIYHVGIIDFLQSYNFLKKLEYFKKKKWLNKTKTNQISCVNPDLYASRFVNFCKKEVFWYN